MPRTPTIAVLLLGSLAAAQAQQAPSPGPSRSAVDSAFASIEALVAKIRTTPPAKRSPLLDRLYERCDGFLRIHFDDATPAQRRLAGVTWLQLSGRAKDRDAFRRRLAALLRRNDLPPDLARAARRYSAQLALGPGRPAPDFAVSDLRAEAPLRREGLAGRIALIVFWAAGNPSATVFVERKIAPLSARFGERPGFLLVSVGEPGVGESPAAQRAWADAHGASWAHGYDADGACAVAYGVTELPYLALVDAKGKLLAIGPGWRTIRRVEALLRERLAPSSASDDPPAPTAGD